MIIRNPSTLYLLSGHVDACKVLIETMGFDLKEQNIEGMSAVHLAAVNNHSRLVEYFGSLVDLDQSATTPENGYNVLHRAALHGSIDVVTHLVKNGSVPVNSLSSNKCNP